MGRRRSTQSTGRPTIAKRSTNSSESSRARSAERSAQRTADERAHESLSWSRHVRERLPGRTPDARRRLRRRYSLGPSSTRPRTLGYPWARALPPSSRYADARCAGQWAWSRRLRKAVAIRLTLKRHCGRLRLVWGEQGGRGVPTMARRPLRRAHAIGTRPDRRTRPRGQRRTPSRCTNRNSGAAFAHPTLVTLRGRMSKITAVLGSALFFVVAPAMLAGVIPWSIT